MRKDCINIADCSPSMTIPPESQYTCRQGLLNLPLFVVRISKHYQNDTNKENKEGKKNK